MACTLSVKMVQFTCIPGKFVQVCYAHMHYYVFEVDPLVQLMIAKNSRKNAVHLVYVVTYLVFSLNMYVYAVNY